MIAPNPDYQNSGSSLLRPVDVAARCAVSMRTVRAWIASGRLRVIRFGSRCVRIDPLVLDRFIQDSAGEAN